MPIIGFSYLKAVRFASEGAFSRLMLGEKSWIFVLQVLLINVLIYRRNLVHVPNGPFSIQGKPPFPSDIG
ncbi:MAG: hypothetical protein MPW15_14015 [Candidatus Manganitrophus sp.]|nr:hypothetical protein [Candidatus Manganitrophus sp.]